MNIHQSLAWDEWLDERFTRLSDIGGNHIWLNEEVEFNKEFRRQLAYILWFIRLNDNQCSQVTLRLKMPVKMRNMIFPACELWKMQDSFQSALPSENVNLLDDVPIQSIIALYMATDIPELHQNIRLYVTKWRDFEPKIDGNDLRELGLPPGPVYRKILNRIRAAWLDGEVVSPDEENTLLKGLIAEEL